MPRKLLAVNLALLIACALFVALMIRTSRTGWPAPEPARARPPATAAAPVPPPPDAAPAAQSYGIIAARNLFSPTRTEAPPTPVAQAATLPKPNLFGVIVRDSGSIAYLEDPVTKRVAGYRQGDAIAGGTVQTIASDRIVLARPDGNVDVRLHDPSRPKPAPAPTPPAAGVPGRPTPGVPPGAPAGAVPTVPPAPQAEGQVGARRPLPPNLLRRLPPAATTPTPPAEPGNAPQQ